MMRSVSPPTPASMLSTGPFQRPAMIAASPVNLSLLPSSDKRTWYPRSRSKRAATNPSPPLLPGPQSTEIRPAAGVMPAATSATARPAFSMSTTPGVPASIASRSACPISSVVNSSSTDASSFAQSRNSVAIPSSSCNAWVLSFQTTLGTRHSGAQGMINIGMLLPKNSALCLLSAHRLVGCDRQTASSARRNLLIDHAFATPVTNWHIVCFIGPESHGAAPTAQAIRIMRA